MAQKAPQKPKGKESIEAAALTLTKRQWRLLDQCLGGCINDWPTGDPEVEEMKELRQLILKNLKDQGVIS